MNLINGWASLEGKMRFGGAGARAGDTCGLRRKGRTDGLRRKGRMDEGQ